MPWQLWQWRPDPAASAGTCRYLPTVALTLRQGRELKALIDTGKKPRATVVVMDDNTRLRSFAPYGTKSGTSFSTPYAAAGGWHSDSGARGLPLPELPRRALSRRLVDEPAAAAAACSCWPGVVRVPALHQRRDQDGAAEVCVGPGAQGQGQPVRLGPRQGQGRQGLAGEEPLPGEQGLSERACRQGQSDYTGRQPGTTPACGSEPLLGER